MKIRSFRFSKSALFIVFVNAFFGSGCDSGSSTGLLNSQPQDQSSSSSTQGTSIYRYLSAINNAYPDKDSLTSLCIRQHGFNLELPKQSIKFAHDIRLPASERWSETKQIVQRYRIEIIQPPPVNGIVMKPVKKEVPHNVTKDIEVFKSISGTCIGIEYILN